MEKCKKIEREIEKIKERNAKVEADKAWEVSTFRKVTIGIMTYLVIVLFFYFADLPKPFTNAIIPTIGFVLSTLSIPFFKNIWIKHWFN